MNTLLKNTLGAVGLVLLILAQLSCRKLAEVNAPITSVNAANVYNTDATAAAVLTGIYTKISDQDYDLSVIDNINGISLFPSLSADDLTLYDLSNTILLPYYRNDLNSLISSGGVFWNSIYPIIFVTNSAIEGLNNSTGLTPAVKQQLLGEAKFMRAFCYFYLINLYGDVPLATSSDYKINSVLPRTSKGQVYQQILADLKDAQNLLSTNYLMSDALSAYAVGSEERVRPTKWAATALLARVYLYTGDYVNAETQATAVINNSSLYRLTSLNSVFLKNSTEAIWQLQPVRTGTQSNTGEGALFILPATGPDASGHPVYLANTLINSFEAGDKRRVNWVDSVTVGSVTYYYAFKYKISMANTATAEYIMIMRLAEQYLIRAEARVQQNNISGGQIDLDTIRTRVSLPGTLANDKPSLLAAILHERQVEFFTEWGHRWFDLKRTDNIDAVMATITPLKGGSWSPFKALYPIPSGEKNLDLNMTQNTGY